MGVIFQSLGRTIIAGVVLVVILLAAAGTFGRMGEHGYWLFFMRWLHIGSGVMWIGLLWYFNFVQTPSMPKIPDEQKPAISKVIAPTALFWFRWSALATVITGLAVAGMNGYLGSALMLAPGALRARDEQRLVRAARHQGRREAARPGEARAALAQNPPCDCAAIQ